MLTSSSSPSCAEPPKSMKPARRILPSTLSYLLAITIACALSTDGAHAIGGQFGLEFAIDAPWRLEPVGDGAYGPIPIVITFHDAIYEVARGGVLQTHALPKLVVGTLTEVLVEERLQDKSHLTQVLPNQLREVERKSWISTRSAEPLHERCRPFLGESCEPLLDISPSHEWHAVFWYTPRAPVTPGRNIQLLVSVKTNESGRTREWVNALVVHAGEAPLPRFGKPWLYGDLHYHAQMTDNEGESGYSYRNVVRAMGAMGMDFVFATDHASSSNQVDGAASVRRCGSVEGTEGRCAVVGMDCTHRGQRRKCQGFSAVEARDLNPARFAAAKNILYGQDGADEAVARDADTGGLARFRSAGVLPQIYMGEEVDAWPEISAAEQQSGAIEFGNGLSYFWFAGGGDCRDPRSPSDLSSCRKNYTRKYAARDHRSYLLLDEQGIPVEETFEEELPGPVADGLKYVTPDGTQPHPSRQHLVYFPNGTGATREGFVGSETGPFGGASKKLETVIREIEAGGYAFLAHPLSNMSAGSNAGPDLVPYSDKALDRAFRSPAILGLQLWNENDRRIVGPRQPSEKVVDDSNSRYLFLWPFDLTKTPWQWRPGVGTITADRDLVHGAFTWDRYLRKGLTPSETAGLSWLPKGAPRKWLMAGGSDAHGDLNYRRQGRPCMSRWCDVPVSDTAIGKPRNLVHVRQPLAATGRYGNRQVIDALRSGEFSITDGPALRIAIDKNASGKIEDTDLPMGSTFDMYPGEHIPLLVEWQSTQEFGPVEQIDVYLGTAQATYAPAAHGPLGAPTSTTPGDYRPDGSGVLKIKLETPTGPGAPRTPSSVGMQGTAKLFLTPRQFRLVTAGDPLFYIRAFARTSLGAYAGTTTCPAGERCSPRLAFTNPIWGRYHAACPAQGTTPGSRTMLQFDRSAVVGSRRTQLTPSPRTRVTGAVGAVGGRPEVLDPGRSRYGSSRDQDANDFPDTCERDIPDPCPAPTGPAGVRDSVRPSIDEDVRTTDGGSTPTGPTAKPAPPRSCQVLPTSPRPPVTDRVRPRVLSPARR